MVKTFYIFSEFEIYSVEKLSWSKEKHRHNFFEILYIEYGNGLHFLNGISHRYDQQDIYMLTPSDTHAFKTTSPTKFHCLRFLPEFFSNNKGIQMLEGQLYYYNQTYGNLEFKDEKTFCESLILKIIDESSKQSKCNETIIRHLMIALLQIISRNTVDINTFPAKGMSFPLHIDSILTYIRANIAHPKRLRKSIIAMHFNVSVNYIGEYFSKHVGASLRAYIKQARLTIAREKLKSGNLSISEISEELGFTDSSHFNKFIKQNTGKSPSALTGIL